MSLLGKEYHTTIEHERRHIGANTLGNPTNKGGGDFALRRQIGCDGVKWGGRAGAAANSPALMVESSTVALGESGSVSEVSTVRRQLSSS